MRRGGISLLHHALDFFQLFHQMQLGWQPARGIDQHHILAAGFASAYRVKAHRCRVTALLADDLYRIAVGPDAELFACCGPKGVGCSQKHRCAFVGQMPGELADGRGFTGSIDPRHHDDGRLLLANHQGLFEWFQ